MSCDYKVEDLIRVIRRVDTYHTPAPGDRGFVTMVERDRAHLTILGSEGKVHAYTGAPSRTSNTKGTPCGSKPSVYTTRGAA
jgi:hypothetical protein